jgi:hypothetical protein
MFDRPGSQACTGNVASGNTFLVSNLRAAVTALEEFLADFLSRSATPSRADMDRARIEVWLVVDELHALGERPERVVVFVKQIVADAGFSVRTSALPGCVVPWCIERYYREHDSPAA